MHFPHNLLEKEAKKLKYDANTEVLILKLSLSHSLIFFSFQEAFPTGNLKATPIYKTLNAITRSDLQFYQGLVRRNDDTTFSKADSRKTKQQKRMLVLSGVYSLYHKMVHQNSQHYSLFTASVQNNLLAYCST